MDSQEIRLERFADYADLELVRRWLESMADKSPKTRAAYTDGLLALLGWSASQGLDFAALAPSAIAAFKNALVDAGRKPSTISVYLAGVRSYYRWVDDSGLGEDVARKVRGGKQAKGFKKDILSREATWEILNAIDQSTLQGKRDYALINLMVRTAVRFLMLILSAIECSMYLTYAAVNCLADLKRGVSSNGEASGFAEPQLCPCQ